MTELTAQQAAERIEAALSELIGPFRSHSDAVHARNGYLNATSKDAIRLLLAERRELLARQVPEWLPIDSAPKDGTALWLGDHFSMRVGFWRVDCWADFDTGRQVGFTPNKWQPLPAPPSSTATDVSQYSKPDRAPGEDGFPYG